MSKDVVYLLHFSKPFYGVPQSEEQRQVHSLPPRTNKQVYPAQHYLGYTTHLKRRLVHHQDGAGAKLTKYAVAAGCELIVARTWQGDRTLERKLKTSKHHSRLCPICNPNAERRGKVKG